MNRPGNCARSAADRARRLGRQRLAPACVAAEGATSPNRASTAANAPVDISVGGSPASTVPPTCSIARTLVAAMRTSDKMRCDGDMLAKVENTRRKRRQQFIRWMVMDRHEKSPNRPRSRFIASRNRDFTVPSGILKRLRNFRMSLFLEERQFDDPQLILRQYGQCIADPRFQL